MSDSEYEQLSTPTITITIPKELCSDFLGIMCLDVLHDAKASGHLATRKLSEVTDLLAESIIEHSKNVDPIQIQDYTFTAILNYFLELWSDNIQALGISNLEELSTEVLRSTIEIPLRNVSDKPTTNAFISLGKNKLGPESQNYRNQSNKLVTSHASTMSFVSPYGVSKARDYFNRAAEIVDAVRSKIPDAKIVLDMKSAAGLLRTITDPIGYTTGLPTYADPGYNMPGMSAIRKHAEIAFMNNIQSGFYRCTTEFIYQIKLETDFSTEPLTLMHVSYFYGNAKDGLDRNNLAINILNENFYNSLPRSSMMARLLNNYLDPKPLETTISLDDILTLIDNVITNYYDDYFPDTSYIRELYSYFSKLHHGDFCDGSIYSNLLPSSLAESGKVLYNWAMNENNIIRNSYLLVTIRNLYFFDVYEHLTIGTCLFPEEMIKTVLPELMYKYVTGQKDLNILAFCYYQLKLLEEYIGTENSVAVAFQPQLLELLEGQWLPRKAGKLTNQISKQLQLWRTFQSDTLKANEEYIEEYLERVVVICKENLAHFIIDEDTTEIFNKLPGFTPPPELKQTLMDHLHFYKPELFTKTTHNMDGLLLEALLDALLWKKPLYKLSTPLNTTITTIVNPENQYYDYNQLKLDAIRGILGKFSGDFGQIIWCIRHGHIFASEDNNTSAMAMMLHRIPKECIQFDTGNSVGWGNIHGLGDGSCVDITIDN